MSKNKKKMSWEMGPPLSFYMFKNRLPSEMVTVNEMGGRILDVLFNDFKPCDPISFGHMVIAGSLTFNFFFIKYPSFPFTFSEYISSNTFF